MIKDIDYQEDAVNELVKKTLALLNMSGSRKKLVFKAPTGSGKTVMASRMLDDLTTQLAEEGKAVAIIWIAPNKLHEQSYMRMKNFFSETRVLRPVMYDELDHSANGYIKAGEIFFVNWESINKDKNLMIKETETSSSLYDITRRTQEEHGLPILVVIDEEQAFTGNAATQSQKVLENIDPKVEIHISATPTTTSMDELVNVPREKVIEAEMIKDGITINPLITDTGSNLSENEYLLDIAIAKRNEIKEAYEKLGVRVNPLLLIQLPNDARETVDEDERKIIEMVKLRLKFKYQITTENGKLGIWLAGEKKLSEGLEDNYNLTEVLLFKQAIAMGWDCPRAAVLLIFRDIKSTIFGVQTIGRIMRMPEQRYYPNQLLNHGWVYTNLSRDLVDIAQEDMNYISKAMFAYRREGLKNVLLHSYYSMRLSSERNRIGSNFYPILVKTFSDNWFNSRLQDLFDVCPYEEEGNVEDANTSDSEYQEASIPKNRQLAERLAGIDFDKHRIQDNLIKDVEITEEAGTTVVDEYKQVKYAKTSEELSAMLTKFCKEQLPGFESLSITSLRGYLYQFMEKYLGFEESESPRIILYNNNKSHFAEIIHKSIEIYKKDIEKRRQEAMSRSFVEYDWEVSENRVYNEENNHEVLEIKNHALLPFIRLNTASEQEKNFEAFLESQTESIEWWYKNGNDGKDNFSIPYTNTKGSMSLFYVDYIILMKNSQIFLFDTKTENSDFEAANKHNALIDYMKNSENADLHLQGGIIIEKNENWYFPKAKIANTTVSNDWNAFHPDLYK